MKKDIIFNKASVFGDELIYVKRAISEKKLAGETFFNRECERLLKDLFRTDGCILTASCTQAIEMAAFALDIHPGDEVIVSAYSHPSTINPFIAHGATIVMVDIKGDGNIDESLLEEAISVKTKAIIVTHYAGISCQLSKIKATCDAHGIYLIEDCALAFMAEYRSKYLGMYGDLSVFSFHEHKAITCGEGGALLINNPRFRRRAEIYADYGTTRREHIRSSKPYEWVASGSSCHLSALNSAFLYSQLIHAKEIIKNRRESFHLYEDNLFPLEKRGVIQGPPYDNEACLPNGSIFFILFPNKEMKKACQNFLQTQNIPTLAHYGSLFEAPEANHFKCIGANYARIFDDRMLRLPIYYKIPKRDIRYICQTIISFYRNT
jgi:dTDP-4-amino-4,6-dideoxygalactose transaminase